MCIIQSPIDNYIMTLHVGVMSKISQVSAFNSQKPNISQYLQIYSLPKAMKLCIVDVDSKLFS